MSVDSFNNKVNIKTTSGGTDFFGPLTITVGGYLPFAAKKATFTF